MADTKITALTALTGADPANDVIPIVDVSDTTMAASGTTKKISVNNILGASGTATLASATITGDLTVDTSTFKVDSVNNRVGINTATPVAGVALQVCDNVFGPSLSSGIRFGNSGNNYYYDQLIVTDAGSNPSYQLKFATHTLAKYLYGGGANYWEWYTNNTLAMTLNSTGLGVGTSPSYKIHALSTSVDIARFERSGAGGSARIQLVNGSGTAWYFRNGVNDLVFNYEGTDFVTFGSTGNVGIGVTPSAWTTSYNALNIGIGGSIAAYKSSLYDQFYIGSNFFENTSGAWRFINNGYATQYWHNSGSHVWRISTTSNAAGANQPLTWTSAMTLDASGTLLVGTTSAGASGFRCYLSTDSGTTKWSVGPYVSATNFAIVASGSAGGVYLNGTTATSWTALSDERFKDIIEPISNAVAKVGSLRAVIGKIKGDETNTRKSFLIAQDVESVLPEAVDASNPDRLGLAYTDVIPLLVAAIKELTARVQTLETR